MANRRNKPKSRDASERDGIEATKVSADERTWESVDEAVAAFDREMNIGRQRYYEFAETLRPLPPRDRAEAWLEYVASHRDMFGEEEALVYLASRGKDKEAAVRQTVSFWRASEADALDQARCAPIVWHSDGSVEQRPASHTIHLSKGVEEIAEITLGDFWHGPEDIEWTLDATMFRAVEWCDIGGFDAWLRRLANRQWSQVIEGGFNRGPLALYLFTIARSPLAIKSARRAWERMLEVLEHAVDGRNAWEVVVIGDDALVRVKRSVTVASATAFAARRINVSGADPALARRAAELLLATQKIDGSWSMWADEDGSSLLTTAIAVHALAVTDVGGRSRAMASAAQWLWKQQTEFGYWRDGSHRDAVFLTVLCLDAIALADGGQTTLDPTATPPRHPNEGRADRRQTRRRFAVAFSFPGEHRPRVKLLAEQLAAVLGGKERILYDHFHKGELAKPNVDLHLQKLYEDSDLIILVMCAEYDKKPWCGIEYRAIRQMMTERSDDIMLLRAGDGEVGGLFSNVDGYIDMEQSTNEELVKEIQSRLESVR